MGIIIDPIKRGCKISLAGLMIMKTTERITLLVTSDRHENLESTDGDLVTRLRSSSQVVLSVVGAQLNKSI